MDKIKFNTSEKFGKFKILNATNGGPWHKRHANDQYRSNFADYKAARIPYSRNHDSARHGIYGGPYSHDITCIFPDFKADPYDEKSYDFDCTDEAVFVSLDAGTETFFRLGQTIEHQIKKHGTVPPDDFEKWAVICEHIIRHYNEGWANGYELNMQYWEIWNEPDLDEDDSPNKRTWGGTKAQFFDFYEIAAKHLKKCFPNLKIGGPALAHSYDWAEDFLSEMKKRNVPIDFFSWHVYATEPGEVIKRSEKIKELLVKYGFENAESILNEWNYIRGWSEEFVYSIESITGIKGAAFIMAVISAAQKSTIDMLMYYDTRPSAFNGVFDYYTYKRKKGYYPMFWYGTFYDLEHEIRAENEPDDIYTLCGCDKNGKTTAVITYYAEDDNKGCKNIEVDFGKETQYDVFRLDKDSDGSYVGRFTRLEFVMDRNSCLYIKEV